MKKLLFMLFAISLTDCSNRINVYSDFDPEYEIWRYESFGWLNKNNIEANENPLFYNELNDKRIKAAVELQLISQGYNFSDKTPDLLLHYHIITDNRTRVETEPYGYYYGPYWMHLRTNLYPYEQGTLIIDVMDPETNNLIWRGWAMSVVDMIERPKKAEQMIKTSIRKMFERFPEKTHQSEIVLK